MTQNNINLNGINGDSLVEMQDSKLNDYQHQLDMLKAEDKLKQLEEDKLEKIIMLCKSYNEAQSRKQLKSFTVNEGDLILNKIKKPSPLLPWIKISNQDLDFKYVNGLDGKDYENENDEEDEDENDDSEDDEDGVRVDCEGTFEEIVDKQVSSIDAARLRISLNFDETFFEHLLNSVVSTKLLV